MAQIVVPPSPAAGQIEAGIRQAVTVLGTILGMAGLAKLAGSLNDLLLVVGPLSSIIAIVWGQLYTRSQSEKLAIVAKAAPDTVAIVAPKK